MTTKLGSRKGNTGWYGLMIGAALAGLGLVVLGLVLAIGAQTLAGFTVTAGAVNSTILNGSAGLLSLAVQLPLIGQILGFAVILIVLIGAIAVVASRAGGGQG